MQIHEVLIQTGLTRKAVEYYIDQGLIVPQAQENGYRVFSEENVSRLKEIAAYRQLGVSVAEMKQIFSGRKNTVLSDLLVRRSIAQKQEEQKTALLSRISSGAALEDLMPELCALKAEENIAERLLFAFPGYLGQYLSLHFSRFLSCPIESDDQRRAYEIIACWLDDLPPFDLPEDLRILLDEMSSCVNADQMESMQEAVAEMSKNPENYLMTHEDTIRTYLSMKDTEEYRASPAARLMEFFKTFQQQSGYTDVFLPAMEQLSPSYASYRKTLHKANEVFQIFLSPQSE